MRAFTYGLRVLSFVSLAAALGCSGDGGGGGSGGQGGAGGSQPGAGGSAGSAGAAASDSGAGGALVEANCDTIANTGCPGGQHCALASKDSDGFTTVIKVCVATGSVPERGECTKSADCAAGMTCVDNTNNMVYVAKDAGGTCRYLCDANGENSCPQVPGADCQWAESGNFGACIFPHNP